MGLVVVAACVPLLGVNAGLVSTLAVMFIWMGVCTSWNLVLGAAGIFSFGQLAFFIGGGYVSAILSVHLSTSPLIDCAAAIVAGGLLAGIISLPVMRLRGVDVALVTLALHQFLNALISTDYSGLTGGPNGLTNITPFVATQNLTTQAVAGYWIALVCAAVTMVVVLLVLRSPAGLAVMAARDRELVASSRGVMVRGYRTYVFVVSGALAGGLGAVYGHMVGVVAPTLFDFGIMMMLLAMIIVGGKGTIWGPIIGPALLTGYTWWIQGSFPDYQTLGLGVILVFAVVFMRGGVVGGWHRLEERLRSTWSRLE